MEVSQITQALAQYKETILLAVTWLAGSLTHIVNKARKWEKLTFKQHIWHLVISWFVWLMAWLVCGYFGIEWNLLHIIIWISTYSAIQIVDAIDMFKWKVIFNILLDFIKYKQWK